MRNRIKYAYVSYALVCDERKECLPHDHCGAVLYMEGCAAMPAQEVASSSQAAVMLTQPMQPLPLAQLIAMGFGPSETPAKRQRTASDIVAELRTLKDLKDVERLHSPQFNSLKDKLLRGVRGVLSCVWYKQIRETSTAHEERGKQTVLYTGSRLGTMKRNPLGPHYS